MAEEDGTGDVVGGRKGEDGGGSGAKPVIGGGAIGVGAEPIEAENRGVGGEEATACWICVGVVEEGGEAGGSGSGGNGGVGKEEGKGVVDGGGGLDEQEWAAAQEGNAGVEGGGKCAKAAVDGDPSGGGV